MRGFYFFVGLFLLLATASYAQDDEEEERDSLRIYKKIEELSRKRKYTYKLYQMVFRYTPPDSTEKDKKEVHKKTKIKKPRKKPVVERYTNRIIRNIEILSLDPAGYNIKDTSTKPVNFPEKATNWFHIKSRKFTIKNHLLFKRGDSLDPLKIKESERILRTSSYIHDAIIEVVPVSKTKDSVDIFILTQDRWSITPTGSYGSEYRGTVTESNFLGLGQRLEQSVFTRGYIDSAFYFQGRYGIPYIRNTFITAEAFYNTDIRNQNKGISINRPFYSPLAAWAGGLDFASYNVPTGIYINDSTSYLIPLKYNYLDVWNGWSIPFYQSQKQDKRAVRMIGTFRYYQYRYTNTLALSDDRYLSYQTSDNWFSSLGISKRRFYKDSYIYKFGTTEDVPTGYLLSVIGGVQIRLEGSTRLYGGTRCAWSGRLFDFSYFSLIFEAGSYFNHGVPEQGITRVGIGTFSDLLMVGKWKLRQFIGIENTTGFQRGPNERLTINNSNGLRGFDSPLLFGSNKLLIYMQTQLYAPFSVVGFKVAPVLYLGLGSVGNEKSPFFHQNVYPVIAVGMQFRNELLVFNTFQFTIGYYPTVPGTGQNILKFNPLNTQDIQFRQLQMDRPGEIGYY